MDPFKKAKFIRLGYDDETGFFIDLWSPNPLQIICGEARTAARIMRVNRVRHFDYLDGLANNSAEMETWQLACKKVGFMT